MKKSIFVPFISIFFILNYTVALGDLQASAPGWKAGVSRVVITPEEAIWQAGFAERNRPAEGTMHDLWAKAIAFEDASGKRAVLVTTDLIGFRGSYMSSRIRDRLLAKYGLSDAQVILSWSHTHSGPELMMAPEEYLEDDHDLTGIHSHEQKERIIRYSEKLEDQIVNLVGKAFNSMEPVKIFSGQGVARFAMNRRVHDRGKLYTDGAKSSFTQLTQEIGTPVDHSVPVIKVEKTSGELLAVIFGYACHNTSLTNIYKWSGDYAGFAQIELETTFPGVTAMFFAGAGADQNPLPRANNNVGFCRQYGKTLAAAVEATVSEPMQMKELSPNLSTAYSKVDLGFASPPPRKDELLKMLNESSIPNYRIYSAKVLLNKLEQGKSLMTSYPYPVQFWKIGEQNIVILASEVVVDYSVRLKQIYGKDLFVMAYTNEGCGYIPSTRVLREGGYEGFNSAMFTTPWASDIEVKIVQEVISLAKQVGVTLPDPRELRLTDN